MCVNGRISDRDTAIVNVVNLVRRYSAAKHEKEGRSSSTYAKNWETNQTPRDVLCPWNGRCYNKLGMVGTVSWVLISFSLCSMNERQPYNLKSNITHSLVSPIKQTTIRVWCTVLLTRGSCWSGCWIVGATSNLHPPRQPTSYCFLLWKW